ncbi:periplasmic heavy metal sensor [bacterium]|nr:periplasmic heavy metal sensor [bacterium]
MTRQKWIGLALALSVAFNFAFLGAFGYRLWCGQRHREIRIERFERMERFGRDGRPDAFHPPGAEAPPIEFRMEQQKHLKNIRGQFLPKVGETHGRLFERRRALFDLVTASKPDTVAIAAAIEEIGRLQILIEKEVMRQMLRERAVMDPEQKERFREMIMRRFRDVNPFGPSHGPVPPPERQTKNVKSKTQSQEDKP